MAESLPMTLRLYQKLSSAVVPLATRSKSLALAGALVNASPSALNCTPTRVQNTPSPNRSSA